MTDTNEELQRKMIEFIDTQDGEACTEWWMTPREMYAEVLTDFCKHIGVALVVPEFVPQIKPQYKVDRQAILNSLLPELQKMLAAGIDSYEREKND
jgi:hypothetical protein